jgi:ABC-type Fe3+ transport system permease subunit
MIGRRRAIAALGILLLGSLLTAGLTEARAQEAPQASLKTAAEPGQEKPAAPRPPRERMAVNVILAWVWLSIAVLLGLLRLRVREADRVYRMGLTRAGEESPREPGH